MSKEKLTKQQAIEGHRKMWNWIADEIERQKYICTIGDLKKQYCNEHNLKMEMDCFCCEYSFEKSGFGLVHLCSFCPLSWIETKTCCNNDNSLYYKLTHSESWREQASLSRQIANLPERVEGEKTILVADLKEGEIFSKGGREFIVLEQESWKTRICLNGYHRRYVVFDKNNCPDYKKSNIKEYCDSEVYEEFAEIFGEDNIFDEEVDLTTMDGQKIYGSCNCKVRLLTFDEWRKYNQYLPKDIFNEIYWLCTSWTEPDRYWKHRVAACNRAGVLTSTIEARQTARCVPICVIASTVKVD